MFFYRLGAYFSRRRGAVVLLWSVFLLCAGYTLFAGINNIFDSMITDYIDIKALEIVSRAVNQAVIDEMDADSGVYSSLVSIDSNSAGDISAIRTDTVKVNKLKANISLKLLDILDGLKSQDFGVPLGNLTGSSFLLGIGPDVSVRFIPVGAANLAFRSEFTSAGINQTLHRIVLEAEVAVTVMKPGATMIRYVSQQVVLAETVIVGSIPDSYTYIDDTRDSSLDKIIDFS